MRVFLTHKEAANYLEVNLSRITHLINSGKIHRVFDEDGTSLVSNESVVNYKITRKVRRPRKCD